MLLEPIGSVNLWAKTPCVINKDLWTINEILQHYWTDMKCWRWNEAFGTCTLGAERWLPHLLKIYLHTERLPASVALAIVVFFFFFTRARLTGAPHNSSSVYQINKQHFLMWFRKVIRAVNCFHYSDLADGCLRSSQKGFCVCLRDMKALVGVRQDYLCTF